MQNMLYNIKKICIYQKKAVLLQQISVRYDISSNIIVIMVDNSPGRNAGTF